MNILTILGLLFYVLYAIWLIRYINHLFKFKFKAMERLSPEVKDKYWMYIREECGKMSQLHMTLCGLTLAPIRAILIVFIFILWVILLKIIWIGSDIEKPLPYWKFALRKYTNWMCSKMIGLIMGFFDTSRKIVHIKDYDPEYKSERQGEIRGIIRIFNHVSPIDGFIGLGFGGGNASFLAAAVARKTPLWG